MRRDDKLTIGMIIVGIVLIALPLTYLIFQGDVTALSFSLRLALIVGILLLVVAGITHLLRRTPG